MQTSGREFKLPTIGDTFNALIFGEGFDERLDKAADYLSDPEKWKGHPEEAEEFSNLLRPKRGRKLTSDVLNQAIDDFESLSRENLDTEVDNAEDMAQETYSQILEEDPATAEVFRRYSSLEFGGREATRGRVVEILSQNVEDEEGEVIGQETAAKEALTVVNEVGYDISAEEVVSEIGEQNDYGINRGRSLTQQLSDYVFSSLEGEAQAFFDSARSADVREAQPAEDYNPEEMIRAKARTLYDEFTPLEESEMDEIIQENGDFTDHMNADSLIEAVGLARRFDLDEAEQYFDSAGDSLKHATAYLDVEATSKEQYIERAKDIILDAEDHQELDQGEISDSLKEPISDMRHTQEYMERQIGELEQVLYQTTDRTSEETEAPYPS